MMNGLFGGSITDLEAEQFSPSGRPSSSPNASLDGSQRTTQSTRSITAALVDNLSEEKVSPLASMRRSRTVTDDRSFSTNDNKSQTSSFWESMIGAVGANKEEETVGLKEHLSNKSIEGRKERQRRKQDHRPTTNLNRNNSPRPRNKESPIASGMFEVKRSYQDDCSTVCSDVTMPTALQSPLHAQHTIRRDKNDNGIIEEECLLISDDQSQQQDSQQYQGPTTITCRAAGDSSGSIHSDNHSGGGSICKSRRGIDGISSDYSAASQSVDGSSRAGHSDGGDCELVETERTQLNNITCENQQQHQNNTGTSVNKSFCPTTTNNDVTTLVETVQKPIATKKKKMGNHSLVPDYDTNTEHIYSPSSFFAPDNEGYNQGVFSPTSIGMATTMTSTTTSTNSSTFDYEDIHQQHQKLCSNDTFNDEDEFVESTQRGAGPSLHLQQKEIQMQSPNALSTIRVSEYGGDLPTTDSIDDIGNRPRVDVQQDYGNDDDYDVKIGDNRRFLMVNTIRQWLSDMVTSKIGNDGDNDNTGPHQHLSGRDWAQYTKRNFLLLGFIFALIFFIFVVVSLHNSEPASTTIIIEPPSYFGDTSLSPSLSPTADDNTGPQSEPSQALVMEVFRNHNIITPEALKDEDSPQSLALSHILEYNIAKNVGEDHANTGSNSSSSVDRSKWVNDGVLRPLFEAYALMVLYYSMGGDNSDLQWRNGHGSGFYPYCQFLGVKCSSKIISIDPEFAHSIPIVNEVLLNGKNLKGIIPIEIALLRDLKTLELSGNEIGDSLPTVLGQLSLLETLTLSQNSLSGPVPTELGELAQLKVLDISGCKLKGVIPPELGDLTNLERLHMEDNRLNGEIPVALSNLNQVKSFQFHWNDFSGFMPDGICDLKSVSLTVLSADCGGVEPLIECPCCTECF